MRQRLQIARVLSNDPAILLMDEPFGALDAQTRGIMQQELSRIWSSHKKTVLFITHDIEEALLLGDRVAIMTAGPAATIKKVLVVPLARPREVGEEFLRLRREIKGAIEEEVMKSMRQVGDANGSRG
jgi:NitT/TauT family transport system ATP-binding protein